MCPPVPLLLGAVASFFAVSATVPQVLRAFRSRSVEGLSWTSLLLSLATFAMWCVYAAAVADAVQLVNNALAFGLLVALAAAVLRAGGGMHRCWAAVAAVVVGGPARRRRGGRVRRVRAGRWSAPWSARCGCGRRRGSRCPGHRSAAWTRGHRAGLDGHAAVDGVRRPRRRPRARGVQPDLPADAVHDHGVPAAPAAHPATGSPPDGSAAGSPGSPFRSSGTVPAAGVRFASDGFTWSSPGRRRRRPPRGNGPRGP